MSLRRLVTCTLRSSLAVAALAAGLAAGMPAALAGRPNPNPLGANLVRNPGAEAAAAGNGETVEVPNWLLYGGFTAVRYGSPQFPTKQESTAIGGGDNFFAGGPQKQHSRAVQQMDVSKHAALIDASKLKAVVSAFQAGFDKQGDEGQVVLQFLNANGRILGSVRLPKVNGTDETFRKQAGAKDLPAKTRTLRLILIANREQGNYSDAYFDNLVVKLGRRGPSGGR